jgi:hypothetical protein
MLGVMGLGKRRINDLKVGLGSLSTVHIVLSSLSIAIHIHISSKSKITHSAFAFSQVINSCLFACILRLHRALGAL